MDAQDYRELVRQVAYEQGRLSSSAFFFAGEDRLRLRTFGSLASVVVTLEGRMLTVAGDVQPFAATHVPNSDRTVATTFHDVGPGFLLTASLRVSTGSPLVGQVFGVLEVVRGLGATVSLVGVLLQGELTAPQRLAWPGSRLRHSIEGPGIIRRVTGTDPAAAAEISETVPTGARWRLLNLLVTLVTDGNAANRDPRLTIDDGATVYVDQALGANVTASTTTQINMASRVIRNAIAQARTLSIPIPDLVLLAGHRLITITTNIQAGDNYGAPELLVQEWLEGAT